MPDEVYVRICTCGYENPADADTCEKCFNSDLFQASPTRKRSAQESDFTSKTDTSGNNSKESIKLCPECGAELASQKHYPECRRFSTGYTLVWNDAALQSMQLTKTRSLFIGRVPPVDESMMIQLEDSHKTVSRNHAELFLGDDGNPYLRDMGSLNGSYVNGQKIVPFAPTMLKAGDEVAFSRSLTITIT